MVKTLMEHLIKISLVFVFLSVVLAACSNAQNLPNQNRQTKESISNPDLSTDEGVITEVYKRIEAEWEKAGKKGASKPKVCVERLKESEEIIVIGFFRTDVGCLLDAVFIDSRYFEREQFDLSKLALAAPGWEKAAKSERENLAKIWVEKGLLVFAPLPNQTLSAISPGDGNVKVTASSKYPAGVTSRSKVKSFVFDKDGGLLPGSGY